MVFSQRKIFRIVRGVVRDVQKAHPAWGMHAATTDSIAKRLAGTLRGLGVPLVQDSIASTDQKKFIKEVAGWGNE